MLRPPEHVVQECRQILRNMLSGALDPQTACDRIVDLDPCYAPACLQLGKVRLDQGDLDSAESWLWRGLDLWPAQSAFYLMLADVQAKRDPNGALVNALRHLAFRKLGLAEKIPPEVAATFSKGLSCDSKIDFSDPSVFEGLAILLERDARKTPEPPEVTTRLLPYRLLADLQYEAPHTVSGKLLDNILANASRMTPVFLAAVREWAAHDEALSNKALSMIVALLGEIGGFDLMEDLLELGPQKEWVFFLHAQWALWRMGQRFPAQALDAFRASAKGADSTWRCAMAEQIGMLPDMPDLAPAMLEMLDGFPPPGNPDDAGYLLAVVVEHLTGLGLGDQAEETLERYEPSLPPPVRKWIQKALMSDEDFVPQLVGEEIDKFDITDICIDRVFMDDEEDEEDKEEEDRQPVPRVAAVKPGRNDPCWCGSGKKYKKCHLAEDEQAGRSSPGPVLVPGKSAETEDALAARLTRALLDLVRDRSRSDFQAAIELYFGGHPPDPSGESGSLLLEWYVHHYRPPATGRTAVEEYLRRNGSRLGSRERGLLEAWRKARYSLFEVQRLDPGTGVELRDVFAGDTFFVHDVTSSKELVRWDCSLGSVYEFEGERHFVGNGLVVPRSLASKLQDAIDNERKHTGQSAAEFVQANSHRIHQILSELRSGRMSGLKLQNAEGDALEFSSATYDVSDDAAALHALRSVSDFEESATGDAAAGEHEFVWLEPGAADGRRVYGRLELRPGRLRLECNSRRRLKRGRELIEDAASAYVRHLGDAFESTEALKRKAASGSSSPPAVEEIPDDVRRGILMQYKERHYAGWPEEKLPALDGKTPRQAMKTAGGPVAVRDLLRTMENDEQRAAGRGDPVYDFNKLRRELGLEEE